MVVNRCFHNWRYIATRLKDDIQRNKLAWRACLPNKPNFFRLPNRPSNSGQAMIFFLSSQSFMLAVTSILNVCLSLFHATYFCLASFQRHSNSFRLTNHTFYTWTCEFLSACHVGRTHTWTLSWEAKVADEHWWRQMLIIFHIKWFISNPKMRVHDTLKVNICNFSFFSGKHVDWCQ